MGIIQTQKLRSNVIQMVHQLRLAYDTPQARSGAHDATSTWITWLTWTATINTWRPNKALELRFLSRPGPERNRSGAKASKIQCAQLGGHALNEQCDRSPRRLSFN
jgi:hypothetical protein